MAAVAASPKGLISDQRGSSKASFRSTLRAEHDWLGGSPRSSRGSFRISAGAKRGGGDGNGGNDG
eukprot:9716743-Alexandrium_andersonii.AAC.1